MRAKRARAAERSRALGRAFAGAIVAGVVYDLTKTSFTRLWQKTTAQRDAGDVLGGGEGSRP